MNLNEIVKSARCEEDSGSLRSGGELGFVVVLAETRDLVEVTEISMDVMMAQSVRRPTTRFKNSLISKFSSQKQESRFQNAHRVGDGQRIKIFDFNFRH